MFVILLAGVAGLGITGWLATRQKYVEDEVPGWGAGRLAHEATASTPVSPERGGSPSA
jgi:CP family cyanate transporter-like MFS transporter